MPYGNSPHESTTYTVNVEWNENGSITDLSRTYLDAFPKNGAVYWERSGRNTSQKISKIDAKRRDQRPLVLVPVQVPDVYRLPYKLVDPRTGKTYYKRHRITAYRLKKGPWPKRAKKSFKGEDLRPNPLHFVKRTFKTFGDNQSVVSWTAWPGNLWAQYVNGCLWAPFKPRGSNWQIPGPDPQEAMRTNPSPRFYIAAEELSNSLIPRLYDKVKNQDVNLAQALAEYRQSTGMFVETLTRLGRALLKLKKLDLVGASRLVFPKGPKDLANDWLLLQYGIKPLLSDIDGAAKMLAQPEDRYFDIIVRGKKDVPAEVVSSEGGTYGCLTTSASIVSSGSVEVVYKVRLRVDSITRDLSRLGLGNLNSVAWEVIPFSFIADWVLPIGDYLNNTDAFSGLTVVSSHKTVTYKETNFYARSFGGSGNGYTTSAASCGFSNEMIMVERVVDIPIPPLPRPSFKNPLSAGHFANALALFIQLKKGK